ncbi:MAG: hypothetical protein DDT26_02380 [Dehalococcoidia bacterium]|nr:hypothetical protein [Chloroflexota bacterium]
MALPPAPGHRRGRQMAGIHTRQCLVDRGHGHAGGIPQLLDQRDQQVALIQPRPRRAPRLHGTIGGVSLVEFERQAGLSGN